MQPRALLGKVGLPERATQNRVVKLFHDELGYRFLGSYAHRDGNSNVEEPILRSHLTRSGYTPADIARIKRLQAHYLDVREIVRRASGETLDLKPYEADMRHLIDKYINADEPRKISPFDGMSLLEIVVKTGIVDAINALPSGVRKSQDAVAETIENNVRSKIIKEALAGPAYFAKMSASLDEIIELRKLKAIAYEEYLRRIAELVKQVELGHADETPSSLDSPGKRALYNNLGQDEALALKVHQAVWNARPDGWRGVHAKEQTVRRAIFQAVGDRDTVEPLFLIVKAQTEY